VRFEGLSYSTPYSLNLVATTVLKLASLGIIVANLYSVLSLTLVN
jgi:hypothetical protein